MIDIEQRYHQAQEVLREWIDQQGHDRCWYYPDVFLQLVKILDVKATKLPSLPPRAEFEEGCRKYQRNEYENK